MRINEVSICRFRALRELNLNLANMSVIIGENDCGKTSVMLALQTFFDSKKISDISDYFKKDVREPIEIEIVFSEIGDTFTETLGLTQDDKLIVKRIFAFEKPPVTQIKINDEWKKAPTSFKGMLPDFVFVPVNRDLGSHGKMTSTSLFGKLFRPLIRQVVESEAVTSANELREKIRFGITQRMVDLSEALSQQLNNAELKLEHDIEIDFLKGIDIPIEMSDERVKNIPIENRGAGIQSSFILALFRIYAKYETEDFILAIEEPENSLHPRAQREMRWAMQDFSKTSQVLCTTHSPVFLDLGRLEDNIVLRRKDDGSTVTSYFGLEDPNELRTTTFQLLVFCARFSCCNARKSFNING